jgi:membrane-associated protease RseP (regulator of RpoE activity)
MKSILLFLTIGLPLIANSATVPPWQEILGPAQGRLPGAANWSVTWRTNLARAVAEAREGNRPLFVTFRCLPCKQCSAFDKEVLEGGPELNPILSQFITVRLTDAAEINLRLFPVEGFADLDMSWWGWFLSPEGRVYGVFGGRDDVSDATRISRPALIASLSRVLAYHNDPRRPQWNIDGPAPELSGASKSPRQLPGHEGWLRGAHSSVKKQSCLHCHQVNDILREPAVTAKTFDKQRDFDVWPLPENVGLALDRDHGLRVTNVVAGSAADKAGIVPGDVVGAAGGRRCFSQADFRGVLHRGPRGAGEIEVWWTRGGQVMSGKLAVAEGWRKTLLDWRMSVSQGIVGGDPGFFPLAVKSRREKFKIPPDKMAVEPFMGTSTNSPAYAAGLRGGHVVTAVNGESPNVAGRAFLVWFIQKYDPGDRITVTALDSSGLSHDLTYQLPLRGK